jgi:hypothetical protein
MTHRYRSALALSVGLLTVLTQLAPAAEFTQGRIAVYFSPHGGATDAVVHELTTAKTQVLMQAYSFTAAPIAKALVEAHKRGVKILAVPRMRIGISKSISAGTSGARPPEHLSATRLRYAPLGCARPRPARGGYTLRAPRSQSWSGAALLVLGLDTRRRMGEGSAAGVLKISGTVWGGRFQAISNA